LLDRTILRPDVEAEFVVVVQIQVDAASGHRSAWKDESGVLAWLTVHFDLRTAVEFDDKAARVRLFLRGRQIKRGQGSVTIV
jgi:hypothetical protein